MTATNVFKFRWFQDTVNPDTTTLIINDFLKKKKVL